jgi:hypothetical protein
LAETPLLAVQATLLAQAAKLAVQHFQATKHKYNVAVVICNNLKIGYTIFLVCAGEFPSDRLDSSNLVNMTAKETKQFLC